MEAPIPENEQARLRELRARRLLDTPPEPEFDEITERAAHVCEVPIALISLVDENRQWFKSRIGLDVCETSREGSFCAHALGEDWLLEVPDARRDPRFADNPLVLGEPHIRFYAGALLVTPAGHALGTLCVIDDKPRTLKPRQRKALLNLAQQAVARIVLPFLTPDSTLLELPTSNLSISRHAGVQRVADLLEERPHIPGLFIVEGGRRFGMISRAAFTRCMLRPNDPDLFIKRPILDLYRELDVEHLELPADCSIEKAGRLALTRTDGDFYEPIVIPREDEPPQLLDAHVLLLAQSRLLTGRVGTYRELNQNLERRVAERTAHLRESLEQSREQIARRERVERELTKLSLVASKTDNAVIITDARGRIEWVNEGFTRITEYPAEEALGRKPGDLLQGPDTDPRTVGAIRERLRRGEGFRGEIVNYSRSGRAYWLALDIQPVREEDGRITRFIAIESEITERKEAEAAMRRARDQAEAANRAKSEFLANMSHEIRTPLNAIIGFADLLHREDPAPDPRAAPQRREWIDTIRGSGEHLLGLINDVLDLSKIEAGRMEVERIACSPFEIISHVASTLRVRAAEKDLRLRIEYADRLPETIVSDPTRLRQILMNLTGNAIKFTERGEVVLRTRLEESAEAPPRLAIDVIDQGVGIAPEKLEAIFQPFTQADSSTTRRFGGTGLGLTISRRMAEAMGGGLSIRSEEGAGSTFTARVETGPLDPAKMIEGPTSETMRGERREAAPAKKTSDRLGGRVLVVEDGEVNRKLITILLRKAGLEVETAEHGGVGVERALAEPFDLILMDMQMPVMDGYTAAARLRERGVSVPIVALTAHAMKEDREKCLAAGCSGYLSKPIDRDELMRTLAEVLSPADAEPAPEGPTGRIARGADGAGRAEARELVPLRSTIATDEPDLLEVVEQFVEELPDRLQRMREAMREHDLRRLAELAHALKGSGGTVGLEAFTDPAARLERLALDERLDQLAETMDELRDLAARAEAGLRPCVGS